MKREHEVITLPFIDYLFYVENNLIDLSLYQRPIAINGATVVDGYIEVTTQKTFNIPYSNDVCMWNTDGYTLEMECYQINSMSGNNNGGGHGTFVCQGNNPNSVDYWSFGLRNQKLTFYYYSGSQRGTTGTTIVPLNEWHHVKFRYYQGTVTTWIDGVIESVISVIGTPLYSSNYGLVFMGHGASNPGLRIKNIKIYTS